MKKGRLIKRFFAVIAFVVVSVLVFRVKLSEIFNLHEFLVLLFGTILFYIAGNGKSIGIKNVIKNGTGNRIKSSGIRFAEFGNNALFTGCFETLILIIGSINIDSDTVMDVRIFDIASNIRPLAYGFCIWLICRDGNSDKEEAVNGEGRPTLDEYYEVFRAGGLTNREVEIAILAVQGMTNAEIAYELSIAESTVKKHMSNIFEKMGVTARNELKRVLKDE